MSDQLPAQTAQNQKNPGNRSALWALLGVFIGFSLPVLTCMGFFFLFIVGLGAAGSGPSAAGPAVPIHVSGPLTGPAIAIVEVSGPILSGRAPSFSEFSIAASEDILDIIQWSVVDPDVKAILLVVNSPGGSVVASDVIYDELKNVQKPVVVLFGETAASGGYYISMAGDYIVANPNSLVGSIGVISTFPNAQELLDKVGVEMNVIISGEAKDFGSLYRDMTPEEMEYWQGLIDETYAGFVEIVAEGREMSEEEVRALADGRVYTGRKALDLGLVDALGYEQDAINKAATLGLISGEPRVIRYSAQVGFLSFLGGVANNLPQGSVPYNFLERLLSPKMEFMWVP
ncbi:MAG TPA: signal peptide peptidase SppA [Anaerolineales bacterium]|nr:signal peptide peptidase SppA [Anaerolineales bacterium]